MFCALLSILLQCQNPSGAEASARAFQTDAPGSTQFFGTTTRTLSLAAEPGAHRDFATLEPVWSAQNDLGLAENFGAADRTGRTLAVTAFFSPLAGLKVTGPAAAIPDNAPNRAGSASFGIANESIATAGLTTGLGRLANTVGAPNGLQFAAPRPAGQSSRLIASQPDARGGKRKSQPLMPMGMLTEAPLGFRNMCARDQDTCVPSAGTNQKASELSAEAATALLARVNSRVNHRISWQSDGQEDDWSRPNPARPQGDCEDFAIAKRDELIAAGFPAEDLYFAVGYMPRKGLHAVLVARTSKGDMLLDSLNERLVAWNKSPYIWLIRQLAATTPLWSTVPILEQKGA